MRRREVDAEPALARLVVGNVGSLVSTTGGLAAVVPVIDNMVGARKAGESVTLEVVACRIRKYVLWHVLSLEFDI